MGRRRRNASEATGPFPRCPTCGSDRVSEEPALYDFIRFTCNACGHWQLADAFQQADWYELPG